MRQQLTWLVMAGAGYAGACVPAFGSLVNMNTEGPFGLVGATISTTGSTVVTGNVQAETTITTGPGLTASGMVYTAGDATAVQAYEAFESAYSTADLMASTASFAGLTTNQTFTANSVNTFTEANVSTAAGVNLTFNAQGDASAIFIVRVDGSFNVNGPLTFTLENGAQASNIFWIVGTAATIDGGNSGPLVFDGNVLADQSFNMSGGSGGLGSTVNGCVFAGTSDNLSGAINIAGCSFDAADPAGVPEPGTAGMVGLGCLGAALLVWRKRHRRNNVPA